MKNKIPLIIITLSFLLCISSFGYRFYINWSERNNLALANELYQQQISTFDVCLTLHEEQLQLKNEQKLLGQSPNSFIYIPDFEIKHTLDSSKYSNITFIGRIKIPLLGIDYPIIDHTTDELLNISICKFRGGDIHTNGNLSLAGHNNKNNTMFGDLNKLKIGDEVYLEDMQGNFLNYQVKDIFIVSPEEVWVTDTMQTDFPELTLITCTADGKNRTIYKLYAMNSI